MGDIMLSKALEAKRGEHCRVSLCKKARFLNREQS